MEYLPSRSLAGLLAERGRLSPDEAARIGGRVAAALAAAHAAGIVHRDVKPSNVLIGHDGTVKLTDFGISRAAGDGTLTASGMITGTPAYLAPEVARGEQPDQASDVFSLGATLYATTEGQSPHGVSDNSFGLLYRAAAGRIEPPTRSGPLTAVLMRLLAADPAERPTAVEAVELLAGARPGDLSPGDSRSGGSTSGNLVPGSAVPGSVTSGSPVAGSPVAGGPEVATGSRVEAAPGPSKRRKRWLAPVVAAVVLLTASAVAVAAWQPWLRGGASPTPPLGITASDAETLVRRHYEALPEDTARAYANLAVSFQRPFEEYQAFWSQYDDVHVEGVVVVEVGSARYAVRVHVSFTHAGTVSYGRYELGVWPDQGRLQIFSSQQLE
jgi:hypothetical protein